MTERMENALNHIKSSVDVDPWAMEEVERVFKVFDDIKTEIRAYFTAKDKHKHLTFDVEQDIMEIINRHMKGGES